MRIPFPIGLSVGTDIIAHRRLSTPHASAHHLRRLALRFLHPSELSELNKRFPDWRTEEKLSQERQIKIGTHLAGRWAAKEAAKKAWGAMLISFRDLRVETLPNGEVQIICQSYNATEPSDGDRCEHSAEHEQAAKLSISHDGDYAVATVIATPLHPDIVKDLRARRAEAEARVRGARWSTPV